MSTFLKILTIIISVQCNTLILFVQIIVYTMLFLYCIVYTFTKLFNFKNFKKEKKNLFTKIHVLSCSLILYFFKSVS